MINLVKTSIVIRQVWYGNSKIPEFAFVFMYDYTHYISWWLLNYETSFHLFIADNNSDVIFVIFDSSSLFFFSSNIYDVNDCINLLLTNVFWRANYEVSLALFYSFSGDTYRGWARFWRGGKFRNLEFRSLEFQGFHSC